jgi:hypothetical protein
MQKSTNITQYDSERNLSAEKFRSSERENELARSYRTRQATVRMTNVTLEGELASIRHNVEMFRRDAITLRMFCTDSKPPAETLQHK